MIDKIVHPTSWTTQNKFVVKNKKKRKFILWPPLSDNFLTLLCNEGHVNLMGSVRNDDNLEFTYDAASCHN